MTIIESLKAISNYPIPTATLNRIAVKRELEPTETMSAEKFSDNKYRLAEADVLNWLSTAPTVSEGGVNFSYSTTEKQNMKNNADAMYNDLNESSSRVKYGYKGQNI